ncbi:MAG: hypothetical protein ACKV2T_01970 [Kofleriaceae bacterium]
MRRLLAVVVGWGAGVGCVRSAAVPCGDGTVCAPGTTCNTEFGQCLAPDQLVSCVGKQDGELCPVGTETGICEDELCLAVVCGDGVVQGIEQCDGAPPTTSCLELGYDAGFLGCNEAVCAVDLPACRRIGWKAVAAPAVGAVTELASAEGVGYAARVDVMLRFRAGVWEPIPLPPTGAIVFSIFAAAADDAWALTEDGLFRFDGTRWTQDLTSIQSVNNGIVVGGGRDDVYLFATPTIGPRIAMRFDGTGWVSFPSPSFPAGLGWVGSAGVYVSDSSTLSRWSGSNWDTIAQPLASITQLIGFGSTLVLAGAANGRGAIAIGDGATWTTYDVSTELGLTGLSVGVGGRAVDDLYAFELGQNRLVRFDGVRWLRDATLPAGGRAIVPIGAQMFAGTLDGFARESPDAFVEIEDTLPNLAAGVTINAVWGRACDDVFVIAAGASTTSRSQIFRFDGVAWALELDAPNTTIIDVAGTTDGTTLATTYDGTLLRRTGAMWTATTDAFPTPLREVSIAADGTIVALGDDRWLHVFDGAWRSQQLAGVTPTAVLALGRDEVYALAGSTVLRYDGPTWTSQPLPTTSALSALWGVPGGPLIAVGADGVAVHRNAQGMWRSERMPYDDFVSIHGSAGGDVFAIGGSGTIAHFDGEQWAPIRDRLSGGRQVWNGSSCTYFAGGSVATKLARLRRSTTW